MKTLRANRCRKSCGGLAAAEGAAQNGECAGSGRIGRSQGDGFAEAEDLSAAAGVAVARCGGGGSAAAPKTARWQQLQDAGKQALVIWRCIATA